MDRLDGFTRRHRVPVALAWLVALLAGPPFAARQTDHLTSGGFAVPGSGSQAVDRGLAAFDGAQREQLAVAIARRPGASGADVDRAIQRVRRAAGVRAAPRWPAHSKERGAPPAPSTTSRSPRTPRRPQGATRPARRLPS